MKKIVHVHLISYNKRFPINADNEKFIANRKWDESIERESCRIEESFQKLLDDDSFGIDTLNESQNRIINDFYALISERSKAKFHTFESPSPFIVSSKDDILEERGISKLEVDGIEDEVLEESSINKLEADGIYMGGSEQIDRVVRGQAQRLTLLVSRRNNPRWGILKSSELDFVVSDCYHMNYFIPVDPKTYLVMDHPNELFNNNEVTNFNKELIKSSKEFFFAKNLENCGI
ncbi:hypothetical protein [Nitrosomonas communis]|uniref:Uncharacterized protein n=1 Tax=Nitrosomonas communis TaxID=44574 RepID=A0A1I4UDK4_9PROT|nr:hypothetical protein [Nitrosomonas communis]SFM86921.1 hypothetical protein SAMN05421863_10636 [Nitrosomonas communis]